MCPPCWTAWGFLQAVALPVDPCERTFPLFPWHRIGVIHPSVPQTPAAVTAPMVSAAQVGARQSCAELRDSGDLADV